MCTTMESQDIFAKNYKFTGGKESLAVFVAR
jgi:hypothetical protein